MVNFDLPPLRGLPEIGEVKYVQERNVLEEVPVSPVCRKDRRRNLLIQLALRTVHELFQSDLADAFKILVFNGVVRVIDRSVGREVCPTVVSIEAEKGLFSNLDLAEVTPKLAFADSTGACRTSLGHPFRFVPLNDRLTRGAPSSQSE